jgi:uncharacterized damage-inducible protein DinB
MIGYGAHELAESFRTVRRNTIQIADEIPEDQYDFVAAPGARSIRDLLRHIATAPMLQEEMHREKRVATLQGYDFPATHRRVDAEGKKAHSKADLLRMLRSEGERIAAWLASVDDGFLAETFTDVTGQAPRTRFEGLLAMKEHEMHHRGQLMLMQRMLGIVPHLTRQREERARQRAAAAATAAGVR